MGGLKDLGLSLGGSVAGSLGGQIGYGLGELTGYNDALQKRQLEQQSALTNMQYVANLGLMKESYKQQLEMWKNTNYQAQMKELQMAGLNPALMYGHAGAGGTTGGGGASVGGGNASGTAQMQEANNQSSMNGMAMMKLASEIKLNEALANKNNADATTSAETRSNLVAKLYEEGFGQYIQNAKEQYKMQAEPGGKEVIFNNTNVDKYGHTPISGNSIYTQELTTAITKTLAEAGNAAANELLTNTKAAGYWQELLNDTTRADSQAIQAAATKLAAEFNYGEEANWKYWAQLARGVSKDIIGVVVQ